jgi:hypothetical protein
MVMGGDSGFRQDRGMTLVARLKITLKDVEPQVMRQIEVPLKIRLDRLHQVIQAAMGWTDNHLYEFQAGGVGWGVPDPDGFYEGPLPASKTTLQDVLEDVGGKTIHYVYDFGDNWDHVVRIERVLDATPGLSYPRLLKASGACPPEDVGGPWSYAEFLEALADPSHEQHPDMVRWHGPRFDPEDAGIDRILDAFERLAAMWAPRSRKAKAPSRRLN